MWTFAHMATSAAPTRQLAHDFNEGLLMMAEGVVEDQPDQDRADIERQAPPGHLDSRSCARRC